MGEKKKSNKKKLSTLVKQQEPEFVLSEHPKFKWERFKTALKSKSALLLRGTNTEDFVRVFDKIYNGNVHNKINFTRYFIDREYQDDEEGDDS